MKDSADEYTFDLFQDYAKFAKQVNERGAAVVVDDLNRFYNDTYVALEKEFQRQRKIKEFGALLVERNDG